MTRSNPHYQTLCDDAGTMFGLEAAVARLNDPVAKRHAMEEELGPLSETELRKLVSALPIGVRDLGKRDLEQKLGSYREGLKNNPTPKAAALVNGARARWKLLSMEERGSMFKNQAPATSPTNRPLQQQQASHHFAGSIPPVVRQQSSSAGGPFRSNSERCAAAVAPQQQRNQQQVLPSFSQKMQHENLGNLMSLQPRGPQQQQQQDRRQQQQQPDRRDLMDRPIALLADAPPPGMRPVAHQQQQPSLIKKVMAQVKSNARQQQPQQQQQQQGRLSSIGGGLQQQGAQRQAALTPSQIQARQEQFEYCCTCQNRYQLKNMQDFQGTFICTPCVKKQQQQEQWLATQQQQQPAPKSRLQGLKAPLKLDRLPPGHVSAAAHGPAAAGARPRRQAAVKPGSKDTPITIDSDDDADGSSDDGDLIVQGNGPSAAAAGDGDGRRRSQRISLLLPGPNTAQRFAGLRCLFPAGGGPGAVEVLAEDLGRLDPDEFLNDTIIDYRIKKIELGLSPEVRARCHFFNSFFFKKLTEKTGGSSSSAAGGGGRGKPDAEEVGRLNYERVKKWTKGVDVFSKDFLFIPIHDTLHWSLAIICHPGLLPAVAAVDASAAGGRTAAQAAAAAAEARAAAAATAGADGGGSDAAAEARAADSDADAGDAEGAAEPAAAADGGGIEQRPVIIHLDSMTGGHTSTAVGRSLASYLEQEWAHRHGHRSSHHHSKQQQQDATGAAAAAGSGAGGPHSSTQLQITTTTKGNMPCVRVRQLPRQDNHCDCGLFLLTYLESFTHHLPAAVSPDAVSGRKGAPALSAVHPNLLRPAWFDPSLASVLRGQLRYELLHLMISQAADKDSSAVAQAVADCGEYEQSMQLQQQRIQRSEPGEIVAYVGPKHYGEVHKLLEMYRRRLKQEAANRRQAARSSSRQAQLQLQLQQEGNGGGGRTTNAERKRALELAAAEKRAAATAAPVAEAGAADAAAAAAAAAAAGMAYAGPEFEMQQEEDGEQQQQFHSPLPDLLDYGWGSQELAASPVAAAAAAGGGGRGNGSSKTQPQTFGLEDSSDSDLDGPIRAATAPAAAAAAAAGSDAAAASPSQRKRKAAPQQQQQQAPAQGKQSKRQRQQQQQQQHSEQQQLHPEQEEDAIDEPHQQQQQPGGRRRMPKQQLPAAGAGEQQQQQQQPQRQQRHRRLPIPDDAGGSCDDDSGDDDDYGGSSPAPKSSSTSLATCDGDADDEEESIEREAAEVSEDVTMEEEDDDDTSAEALSLQLLAGLGHNGVSQLLQRLRGRFAKTMGNNLAVAVGMPGHTAFVDQHERQEMLDMLQEALGQQELRPQLLQPLLETMQQVDDGAADPQFSAAWHDLIQPVSPPAPQPAVLRPPPPAAAAGAGPGQRPQRRSPTAVKRAAAIAAAKIDPKQRKITHMVPQQQQRQQQLQQLAIVYAASQVPIPDDAQRLLQAFDDEPREADEDQLLQPHPQLQLLQLGQQQRGQQQRQQRRQQQQQQQDVCDMTLDGSSDEGGDGKQPQDGQQQQQQLRGVPAGDAGAWACPGLPLGNPEQQKQLAREFLPKVLQALTETLGSPPEDDEDMQPAAAAAPDKARPAQQQPRPDAAGGGAGSRTRQGKHQQQQQHRAGAAMPNLNPAVGPMLNPRQALQQQQPGGNDNSHSLFEEGAAAFQGSRQKRGFVGRAVRGMQQMLSGMVGSPGQQQQQQPVCIHPPEQPLVDYASESKQTSLQDDELLPTQPAGAGEVTSPLLAKAQQQQAAASAGAAAIAAAAAKLQQAGVPRQTTLAQAAQQAAGQAAGRQAKQARAAKQAAAADGGTIVIDSDTDND